MPSRRRRKRKGLALLLLGGGALFFYFSYLTGSGFSPLPASEFTKERIAVALESSIQKSEFPENLSFPQSRPDSAKPVYTIVPALQQQMEKTLKQYGPDYAAFVAMDAKTGRVLTLASYSRVRGTDMGNFALQATFPAASIFKVVTAAAAIDQNMADPETIISFNGGNHTLYRRNVTQNTVTKWTRRMTLREAFARSVNTVFGKVGLFMLKPAHLEEYAHRFQFNQPISVDLPVQPGTFILNPESDFNIAEAASGYSRLAMMSPLQGAMMAASVINDGVMMEPYMVESLLDENQRSVYKAMEKPAAVVVTSQTARQLRELMRETVKSGTSRHAFRDFARRNKTLQLEIGGKTGSLSGSYPKGKYDWFVGYATDGGHRIAMAALTINEENWRVKASYLTRLYIENYFRLQRTPALSMQGSSTD